LEKALKDQKIKIPDDWNVRVVCEGTDGFKELDSLVD